MENFKSSKIIAMLPPSENNPRNSEGSFLRLDGNRIAFAYSRFHGGEMNDFGASDIVCIYSYDNGESFSDLTKNDLYEIGYRTGRFIYILDAYADRKEDKKEGKYNPFNESKSDTESDAFKSTLITALDMEMVAASSALDRLALEDGGIHAILENLLKLGLGDTARSVIHDNKTLTLIEKESEKIK